MDLKGDCATIGMVRVDEKDKKTPITMDLKGKVVLLEYPFSVDITSRYEVCSRARGGRKHRRDPMSI